WPVDHRPSHPQEAAKSPCRVVRLGAVVVHEHAAVAAVAKKGASPCAHVLGGGEPAGGFQVELTYRLQGAVLRFIQQLDTHGRRGFDGAALWFGLLARVPRRTVIAEASTL